MHVGKADDPHLAFLFINGVELVESTVGVHLEAVLVLMMANHPLLSLVGFTEPGNFNYLTKRHYFDGVASSLLLGMPNQDCRFREVNSEVALHVVLQRKEASIFNSLTHPALHDEIFEFAVAMNFAVVRPQIRIGLLYFLIVLCGIAKLSLQSLRFLALLDLLFDLLLVVTIVVGHWRRDCVRTLAIPLKDNLVLQFFLVYSSRCWLIHLVCNRRVHLCARLVSYPVCVVEVAAGELVALSVERSI